MPDQELVKPKRWEGKPFSFKMKYMFANYPEVGFSGILTFIVLPLVIACRYYMFPGSRPDVMRKFKNDYIVVRDDDPRAEEYARKNEEGKHYFPKY